MHFILYGNFSVPYCSEVHHAKSLEALGHKVTRLQETEITTEEVLNHAYYSDGLIWIHSHGFINRGNMSMKQVLEKLKERGVPTIAYHLDLYMGLERWKEYENSDYFKVSHFFTVDYNMAEWLNAHTSTHGHYLPAGVFHEEVYSIPAKKEYDVVFVGSRGYHREWPYRPLLIDWLKQTYGNRFFHFGNDGIRMVRGRELNEVYAKSKVVVGDALCPGYDYPYYMSDRIFETIGRGGFIIHPYIHGIYDLFTHSDVVTYRYTDFEGLKNQIDKYLQNDIVRETIRRTGQMRVLNEHTYMHRWKKIIDTIYT